MAMKGTQEKEKRRHSGEKIRETAGTSRSTVLEFLFCFVCFVLVLGVRDSGSKEPRLLGT